VRSYLERRQPRSQLDEIRSGAEALRTAMLEHFDAKDLILAVGDPKFHPEYTRIGGWMTPYLDADGAINEERAW
jgi:hypothetical protein